MTASAQHINSLSGLPLSYKGFIPAPVLTLVQKETVIKSQKTRENAGMEETKNEGQESFETLLSHIANRQSKEAFKTLFEHFAPRIKSYIISLGADNQKAESLSQEVMVTIWQKAKMFDPKKAKASTWIFRIARNKFIDQVRKQKYPEVNADDHLKDMVAPETSDQPLSEKQTQNRILKAMECLSNDQREVIELSFFKEMSHSEISKHTSLPLGTVKSRIRMAFKSLKTELGEYE